MEAKQVVDKIIADANVEAEKITRQAQKKLDAKNEQFNRQLDEYNNRTEQLAVEAAEDTKARALAAARMDTAMTDLTMKKKLLDEVFDAAVEKIKTMPDDRYIALMTALMEKAIETGDEEIIVDPQEKRIDASFVQKINQKQGNTLKGNLRLSSNRANIGAGFILQRNKVRINAGAKVLVTMARENLETKLAKELFE
ncbi:MAG: V-type ATP synthase subunit E family protein [Planctomycetota bacterium]